MTDLNDIPQRRGMFGPFGPPGTEDLQGVSLAERAIEPDQTFAVAATTSDVDLIGGPIDLVVPAGVPSRRILITGAVIMSATNINAGAIKQADFQVRVTPILPPGPAVDIGPLYPGSSQVGESETVDVEIMAELAPGTYEIGLRITTSILPVGDSIEVQGGVLTALGVGANVS